MVSRKAGRLACLDSPPVTRDDSTDGLTRRRLLEALGAAGAGAALGGLPVDALAAAARAPAPPFYGQHQAGIVTPAQARLNLAALDVTATSRAELRDLMRAWSSSAARMCARERSSHLTLTFGLGPGLFDPARGFGLAAARPRGLQQLPPFPGDALDPVISGGDLMVQACAGDPGVALRAVQQLVADAGGAATLRWQQAGFGRSSSTSRRQATPRNLMGFKDGTNNLKAEDGAAMRRSVWVGPRDRPAWLRDGSYLVVRRIRMRLDEWNSTPVHRQERVIGRHKRSGAPLGGRREHDPVDLNAGVSSGNPRIPTDAHIRLASPHANGGTGILRRSYNYSDGDADSGLVFLAFQRHPRQFIAIQHRLGQHDDALGNFIVHEASAVFACPPGARRGGFVGAGLL
jgi:deferrochelatase/peroxidase EfeB